MTGLKFIRWFFSLLRPPVKEPTYTELAQEVKDLRRLVDSLCAHTNELKPKGTPDWEAQLKLEHKARWHGFKLIQSEMARKELKDLAYKKQVLLEDNPELRSEA